MMLASTVVVPFYTFVRFGCSISVPVLPLLTHRKRTTLPTHGKQTAHDRPHEDVTAWHAHSNDRTLLTSLCFVRIRFARIYRSPIHIGVWGSGGQGFTVAVPWAPSATGLPCHWCPGLCRVPSSCKNCPPVCPSLSLSRGMHD